MVEALTHLLPGQGAQVVQGRDASRDLLEILEDRHGRCFTLAIS